MRNHFRGQRGPKTASLQEEPGNLVDPLPGPDRVAQARETVAWLEEAMARLPFAQREVLVMTTILGLQQQEVAETLDLPVNTVKTNLRRARLTLIDAMRRRDAPTSASGDSDEPV